MFRRVIRRYKRYILLAGCAYFLTSFWMIIILEGNKQNENGVAPFFTRINDPFGSRYRRSHSNEKEILFREIQSASKIHIGDARIIRGKCYDILEAPDTDIVMEDIWDRVSVGYPKLVLSVTGWVDTITVNRWSIKPLHVIVVPHSHQDPGWRQTAEHYFTVETKQTLDRIIRKLLTNPAWRFIWAETVFLNWWWEKATPKQRNGLKSLIETGQFEVVSGGWVMPDEANTHYTTLIDQLTEGHQWLKDTFNISITSSWAIDPFGHSSTMPYIFKKAGTQNMIIQRTHFAIKRLFAKEKNLEFLWKQSWEPRSEGLLCHMMPFLSYGIPYSCGPDRHVCCKFDFHRRQCYKGGALVENAKVTENNVAELSYELWEQLQKKSELYRSHVVLLPHGDDFRYSTDTEWNNQFTNMEKIMNHINGNDNYKMKIEFGTISDYFKALRREIPTDSQSGFPSLTGDFLTYSDRGDQYWSGIYTTRPYVKYLVRHLQYQLRLSEFMLLFSVAGRSDHNNSMYARMKSVRRRLALHLHHDAITGTSKKHVIQDYIKKLNSSIIEARHIYTRSLEKLMTKDCSKTTFKDKEFFYTMHNQSNNGKGNHKEVYLSILPNSNITLMVNNILGQKRVEIVHVTVNTSKLLVIDNTRIPVRYQISPVWNIDGTRAGGRFKDYCSQCFCNLMIDNTRIPVRHQISPLWRNDGTFRDDGSFKLSFEVRIDAFTIKPYYILHRDDIGTSAFTSSIINHGTKNQNIKRFQQNNGIFEESFTSNNMIKLSNHYLTALVSTDDGLLKYVYHHDSTKLYRSDTHFVTYSTGRTSHPFNDKSGAYIFLPDGPAKEFPEQPRSIIEISGPLFTQVRTTFDSVTHVITVFNISGFQARGVHVENIVNISSDYWDNRELAMRVETDIYNHDHTFCTDANGFQLHRRKTRSKMTIQVNFHPVTTMALTENQESRFTLLTTSVHGVASLVSGWLEAMLDRRLSQDDWRGLNENVTDNVPITSTFFLLFEQRERDKDHISVETNICHPSPMTDVLTEELNNPLAVSNTVSSSDETCTFTMNLARGLPCGYHIINVRMLPSRHDMNEALIVIHHRGTDCGFPTSESCENKKSWSFRDITSLNIIEVKETSITGVEVQRILRVDEPLKIKPMEIQTYKIAFR